MVKRHYNISTVYSLRPIVSKDTHKVFTSSPYAVASTDACDFHKNTSKCKISTRNSSLNVLCTSTRTAVLPLIQPLIIQCHTHSSLSSTWRRCWWRRSKHTILKSRYSTTWTQAPSLVTGHRRPANKTASGTSWKWSARTKWTACNRATRYATTKRRTANSSSPTASGTDSAWGATHVARRRDVWASRRRGCR
jgi:hypothetical protein